MPTLTTFKTMRDSHILRRTLVDSIRTVGSIAANGLHWPPVAVSRNLLTEIYASLVEESANLVSGDGGGGVLGAK